MQPIISVEFEFEYYQHSSEKNEFGIRDKIVFCPRICFEFKSSSFSITAKATDTEKCNFVQNDSNPSSYYLNDFPLDGTFTDQGDDSEWGMGYQPIVDIEYTLKVSDYMDELRTAINSFNNEYADKFYLYIKNNKVWLETDPEKIKEIIN